jgi:peroxiredoxin
MRDKILSGVVIAGALALLLAFARPTFRQGEPSQAGRPAPEFTFELDGRPVQLSSLRGQIVVLNFWATWCPPCVEEMPSLDRLHAQLAPLGGMVLGVSVDRDEDAFTRFLRDHQIRFPNHRDPSAAIAVEYGSVMYPETYIIARDGKIARKIIGPQNWDSPDWIAYFQRLAGSS